MSVWSVSLILLSLLLCLLKFSFILALLAALTNFDKLCAFFVVVKCAPATDFFLAFATAHHVEQRKQKQQEKNNALFPP
jgi:hypothetical protein